MIAMPDDIARCKGVGDDDEGWREGCQYCARRIIPPNDPHRAVYMAPPAIIVFECEYLIEVE